MFSFKLKRSTRRLLLLLASLPAVVVLLALLYMAGMSYLEHRPRGFWFSLEWAAETLTTTGYGADSRWSSPLMVLLVIAGQFLGVFLVFLVVPIYLLPFFEERFEGRLPSALPALDGSKCVLVYRYGPAVAMLIEDLARFGRRVVVLEEDRDVARRLQERGLEVVHASLGDEYLDLAPLRGAEAIVANGEDHDNAALVLIARELGFEGPIFALVDEPLHRHPLQTSGASAVYTPRHVLAAALAAKASRRIQRRVSGLQQIGDHVTVAEMRIHPQSRLAGRTLADLRAPERLGVTVVGRWVEGEFRPGISGRDRLEAGTIIVAIGSPEGVARLGGFATPLKQGGKIVVLGYGEVGRKIVELLRDAGERTTVIDVEPSPGVDVVGNALDPGVLERAGVREASAVVLALSNDNEALFAATVVRDFAPGVPLVARVNQAQTVKRLYQVGTDFALSIGQVAGQLLAHQMLGEEYVSLEPTVKIVRVDGSAFAGQHPLQTSLRGRADVLVVALERAGAVVVEFSDEFRIAPGDALYLCGAPAALDACFAQFPLLRARPAAREANVSARAAVYPK
ncbi:MAG TPA: NAD-binding protein [Burkholderiales bacterium]|nr:NAD-binding protein [Burkholderiales bacterium]